jgi:hypothetical protein
VVRDVEEECNFYIVLWVGPKRDEVTGDWGKLHNGELHNLYSSPDIIRPINSRRMRWAGHVARMGGGRDVYRVLMEKPEGKRSLERPRRRWEYGIKMDLREIGWGGVEWIHLAEDRDRWRAVVNAVTNLRVLGPRNLLVMGCKSADHTMFILTFPSGCHEPLYSLLFGPQFAFSKMIWTDAFVVSSI